MKKGVLIFWLVVLALIIAGVGTSLTMNTGPGKLDGFAQFWCPHCQATNKMFGKSKALLPYVECSTPDGQSQTQICKDKGINGYPTWVFPDGSVLTGERTLQELADKTACQLPK